MKTEKLDKKFIELIKKNIKVNHDDFYFTQEPCVFFDLEQGQDITLKQMERVKYDYNKWYHFKVTEFKIHIGTKSTVYIKF